MKADSSQRGTDSLEEEERARGYLLRALSAAPRTRFQLAQGLTQREITPELSERLLDRFVEVGLIDDAAYARTLTHTRFTERSLSRRAIKHELVRKGVPDQAISDALTQIDSDDEEQAARDFLAKRLPRTKGLDRTTRMRRLAGALGRKGFSSGLAMRLISEALEAEGAQDPE